MSFQILINDEILTCFTSVFQTSFIRIWSKGEILIKICQILIGFGSRIHQILIQTIQLEIWLIHFQTSFRKNFNKVYLIFIKQIVGFCETQLFWLGSMSDVQTYYSSGLAVTSRIATDANVCEINHCKIRFHMKSRQLAQLLGPLNFYKVFDLTKAQFFVSSTCLTQLLVGNPDSLQECLCYNKLNFRIHRTKIYSTW